MKLWGMFVLLAFCLVNLGAVTVDPAKAVIVVKKDADGVIQFAGKELQKYLLMITGKKIPIADQVKKGRYPFIFGTPAGVKLAPEEARWEVGKDKTLLYGDSTLVGSNRIMLYKVLDLSSKSGDLTAVYDFLEKQLGVLFLAPGNAGISYEPRKKLELKEGKSSWTPTLSYRYLWPDRTNAVARRFKDKKFPGNALPPADFVVTNEKEYHSKKFETFLWLKQQRIGRSKDYAFGHAFTDWWERFGKTNPEYFALVNGKRGPKYPNRPKWVKLCVSNPAVWKKIVSEWAKNPKRGSMINICENDGGGFCECAECRKLDMPPRNGLPWDKDLSDRYVYFGKQIRKEIKKIDPNAIVCQYAYSVYRNPPLREKLDHDTHLSYVPSMLELDSAEKSYQEWHKAGARHFLLRPNDLHINTSLPMGFEKTLFDAFKLGLKYGAFGTRYDSLHGFWDISGIADYLIARGNVDTTKDFDYWMNEYCSAYGAAAPEVRKYFDHFRINIWEKGVWQNRKSISARTQYGNFRKVIMLNIHEFYKESDFDTVEGYLRAGLKKELTPNQRKRLENLLLVNEHSRLTYRAMAAQGREKILAAVKLLKFRRANKEKINVNWEKLFHIEIANGDGAGIRSAMMLADYSDFDTTPVSWRFAPDPKDTGVKEQWFAPRYSRERNKWGFIRTDGTWEKQNYKDPELKKMMEKYDGIGWYAQNITIRPEWKGKKIYMVFGAVDESAWLYINGKPAGERVYQKDSDYYTPFALDITNAVDWNRKSQNVVVRVQDKTGAGGIWKPVYVTAAEK